MFSLLVGYWEDSNYKCSYCWPYARSDPKDHRPTRASRRVQWMKSNVKPESVASILSTSPCQEENLLSILDTWISGASAKDVENTNYTLMHMTLHCSPNMKWFGTYVDSASKFPSQITASLHTEHVNTPEKMQEFADKLIFCEHDVSP